jgi:acetyl-CoA acyltransferase
MIIASNKQVTYTSPMNRYGEASMQDVVIAGYARSPFHFAQKGALARVRPDDLLAAVVRGLVERTGVDVEALEDLIVGCAFPEGEQGLNIARLAGMLAGLPQSVGGATVNRFCGSSMQAIHMAAGAIQMNAGDAFICAGVESMSRVPMMGFNPLPNPALASQISGAYMGMGETAENVARRYEISREMQEAFAVRSQRRASAARDAGRFSDEIVPIKTKAGTVDQDGCLRPETTAEGLAALKPAFDAKQGTATAGTASPLTDGASAVLVCTASFARAHGLDPLARIAGIAISGCAPEFMGLGPIQASRKALARAGDIPIEEVGVVELNEAFASQALACIRELGVRDETLNLDGGAIALGHPLGATGARIVGKAASLLRREGARYALATQCIGGGQGIATVLERV